MTAVRCSGGGEGCWHVGTRAGGRQHLQRSNVGAGKQREDKGDKGRKGECGCGGDPLTP